jgi:hypothetical protein
MIKINYKEPEESETPDQIAQYNIIQSDKFKKADYLEISSISWLKIDSKRDYQDLEQLFRQLNLDSYVIAQPVSYIPPGVEINYPNGKDIEEPLEYIAKITCRPKDESLKEVQMYHTTWEENFNCLKKTGCFMAIKQPTDVEDQEKVSTIKGVNEVQKVLECRLKLDYILFKPIESINFIIEDLAKQYGKTPEKIICGQINESKVYALMLDGEIISPIGWMEKNSIENTENEINTENETNKEIEYELVDFRKIKMERA